MASLLMADDLFETGKALKPPQAGRRPAGDPPMRRIRSSAGGSGKLAKRAEDDCPGPGASLDCEGGAARCVR